MQKSAAKIASLPISCRCRNRQRKLLHQFYIYIYIFFLLGVYSIFGWSLPIELFLLLTLLVYTEKITIEIEGILKNQTIRWRVSFCERRYRWNYCWIQTGKTIQWRVTYTDIIIDGLIDEKIMLINPSVIVNIWLGHRPPLPYFFFFVKKPLYNKTNTPHIPHHFNTTHPSSTFLVTTTLYLTTSVFWLKFDCRFFILSKYTIF